MSETSIDAMLVNPFIFASFSVMSMLFGEAPQKGPIRLPSNDICCYEIGVIIGVTGGARGYVILAMSLEVAKNLSTAMLGKEVASFDELSMSAISELGNMLCGTGLLQLSDQVGNCDLTPPTILKGENVDFSEIGATATVVPLTLSFGTLDLFVSLKQSEISIAA